MSWSRFFNRGVCTASLQVINLAGVVGSMYSLYQNPDSLGESFLDGAVHAYSFYALRQGAGLSEAIGASALNFMRIGAIYQGVAQGCTSFPLAALAVDTLLHAWNAVQSIVVQEDINPAKKEEMSQTPVPQVQ